MKSHIQFLLLVPAWALGIGLCLGAPEVPQGLNRGTVLILHTHGTMEGDIQRRGEAYCIRRGPAEVTIPAEKVLRLCQDWDDAFTFMKSSIQQGDPDERLRLAKWCHINNLREYALAEAKAALDMRPQHAETRQLFTIFRRSLEENQAAPGENSTSRPTLPPAPQIDLGADSLALFANKVQPILLNTCAGCHSGGRGGDFQLQRTYQGGQRSATQRNLGMVLAQVDLKRPTLSPLLIKAVSLHGNMNQAPIRTRKSEPFLVLQEWVELVAASNPHLGEQRWSPSIVASPSPRESSHSTSAYSPQYRNGLGEEDPPNRNTKKIRISERTSPIESDPAGNPNTEEVGSPLPNPFGGQGQVVSHSFDRMDNAAKLARGGQGAKEVSPIMSKTPAEPSPKSWNSTITPATKETTPSLPNPQFPDEVQAPDNKVQPSLYQKSVSTNPPNNMELLAAFPPVAAVPKGLPTQVAHAAQTIPAGNSTPTAVRPRQGQAASAPSQVEQADPYDPTIFNRHMHPQK